MRLVSWHWTLHRPRGGSGSIPPRGRWFYWISQGTVCKFWFLKVSNWPNSAFNLKVVKIWNGGKTATHWKLVSASWAGVTSSALLIISIGVYLIPLSKCVYREAQQYISMLRKQNIRTSMLYFMHVNKGRLLYLICFCKLPWIVRLKLDNLVPLRLPILSLEASSWAVSLMPTRTLSSCSP